jgi:hypothetical protein
LKTGTVSSLPGNGRTSPIWRISCGAGLVGVWAIIVFVVVACAHPKLENMGNTDKSINIGLSNRFDMSSYY